MDIIFKRLLRLNLEIDGSLRTVIAHRSDEAIDILLEKVDAFNTLLSDVKASVYDNHLAEDQDEITVSEQAVISEQVPIEGPTEGPIEKPTEEPIQEDREEPVPGTVEETIEEPLQEYAQVQVQEAETSTPEPIAEAVTEDVEVEKDTFKTSTELDPFDMFEPESDDAQMPISTELPEPIDEPNPLDQLPPETIEENTDSLPDEENTAPEPDVVEPAPEPATEQPAPEPIEEEPDTEPLEEKPTPEPAEEKATQDQTKPTGSTEKLRTLADEYSDSVEYRVADMIVRRKSIDLAKAFSLNDKYRYVRGLFCEDRNDFEYTIAHLSSLGSLSDAYDYLLNELGWDIENKEVKSFITIIANYFNS